MFGFGRIGMRGGRIGMCDELHCFSCGDGAVGSLASVVIVSSVVCVRGGRMGSCLVWFDAFVEMYFQDDGGGLVGLLG